MISRGWIFPDGTEYSLAGFQVHGHTISDYFRYLRDTDEEFYGKLTGNHHFKFSDSNASSILHDEYGGAT